MNRLVVPAAVHRTAAPRAGSRLAPLAIASCVVVAVLGSCTLLLPTDQLIVPCQSQADCDENAGDNFICEDNACLPEDDGASG
ncbi:MAG: hypothetical protein FJ137_17225 [Deltaproteobacteria bacterium]|nr:hypothetical protein [Deltaproteobacteria bacterium]